MDGSQGTARVLSEDFSAPPPANDIFDSDFFTQVDTLREKNDFSKTVLDQYIAAFKSRLNQMRHYFGEDGLNTQKLQQRYEQILDGFSSNAASAPEFLNQVHSHMFGLVTTGHPVTGFSANVSNLFNLLSKGGYSDDAIQAAEFHIQQALTQDNFAPPTRAEERDRSYVALSHAHNASDFLLGALIRYTKGKYPSEWSFKDIIPQSIATWIPFDMDGRVDVTANDAIQEHVRLQVKAISELYLPKLKQIQNGNEELTKVIEKLEATQEIMTDVLTMMEGENPNWQDIQQKLEDTKSQRFTNANEIVRVLEGLTPDSEDDVSGLIGSLISNLHHRGLSFAQPHYRMNSTNVKPLSKAEILSKLTGKKWSDEGAENAELSDHCTLENLARLNPNTDGMLIQLLSQKFAIEMLDDQTHCRQLVAETHEPDTLSNLLKMSKLTGVDGHIQICPLIEDGKGIDNAEILAEFLATDADFQSYLDDLAANSPSGQKKIFIQWGFSDSGREMNGLVSLHSLRRKMAACDALIREKLGQDVQIVFFGTGGHSNGRGRLQDTLAGHQKSIASYGGSHVEQSFQGADGYAYLEGDNAAIANFVSGMEAVINQKDRYTPDQNIIEAQDRFIGAIRDTHSAVFSDDPDYFVTVGVLKNFMGITGSRAINRPDGSGGARSLPRAIQHNGAFQQLGHFATISYGVGAAIAAHPDDFQTALQDLDFKADFERILDIIASEDHAAVRASIEIFNPDYWRHKAGSDPDNKEDYELIAREMDTLKVYNPIKRTVDKLLNDADMTLSKANNLGLINTDGYKSQRAQSAVMLQNRFVATTNILLDAAKSQRNGAEVNLQEVMQLHPLALTDLESLQTFQRASRTHMHMACAVG